MGGAHDGLLTQVLADLVDKNVISQDQSDAITKALQDKAAALQAQAEQRRALLKSFVQDGVITQAEIDQLPADDPLRKAFDSIAQNGQINVDQLRGLGPGFGHGRGHGFGPGMRGPWSQCSDQQQQSRHHQRRRHLGASRQHFPLPTKRRRALLPGPSGNPLVGSARLGDLADGSRTIGVEAAATGQAVGVEVPAAADVQGPGRDNSIPNNARHAPSQHRHNRLC